jgi:hypothetical protein
MTEEAAGGLSAAISEELAACRQRGIERLDVSSHNQVPVKTPVLQRLGSEYVSVRQVHARGRVSQLKFLFRDAIKSFAAENETDAQLVGDLLFGDSLDRVTKSAGELLDLARGRSEYRSEALFRQARHEAFGNFAHFITGFVEGAQRGNARTAGAASGTTGNVSVLPQLRVNSDDSVPDPEVRRQNATTGYVDNGEHFIQLLAGASNATIVGFTNESLALMLRAALDRKRAASPKPDACWDSIRIVFLGDKLLDLVNDERVERREYPDPEEERKQRRRAAVHGRRTVDVFLRSLPASRWTIYESPYLPPLFGSLFELPNGQRVVQLLIRRPQRTASEHLYVQLDDTQGNYFSAAFEEIVHSSVSVEKIVLVGSPAGKRFQVASTRYRHNVLKDGSQATGWLPLVLILTWRRRNGRAEPLVQLRTQLNASREFDRLGHLSSHILQDDLAAPASEFGLEDPGPLRTAWRRIQMETGEESRGELIPLGTHRYIYPDKEHLFFFVYGFEFQEEDFRRSRQLEIFPAPMHELLSIRENQALRMALLLCESPPMRTQVRADAFEIVTLNLTIHGHAEVARKLTTAAGQGPAAIARVGSEIRAIEEQTRQTWPGLQRGEVVMGLPGLQYREFFTLLLPFYSSVGAPDAAEYLRVIDGDQAKREAVARLSRLYHDEGVMEAIPLEL